MLKTSLSRIWAMPRWILQPWVHLAGRDLPVWSSRLEDRLQGQPGGWLGHLEKVQPHFCWTNRAIWGHRQLHLQWVPGKGEGCSCHGDWMSLFRQLTGYFKFELDTNCCSAVESMPSNQEVLGYKPAECRAFFFLFLLALISHNFSKWIKLLKCISANE